MMRLTVAQVFVNETGVVDKLDNCATSIGGAPGNTGADAPSDSVRIAECAGEGQADAVSLGDIEGLYRGTLLPEVIEKFVD